MTSTAVGQAKARPHSAIQGVWTIWRWPAVAALLFVSVAEAVIILSGLTRGGSLGWLAPAETLSLLSGAVTAAGLTAVYSQFREGNRAAASAAREAALRLDELHAAFNAPEMQVYRDIGWTYLKAVAADDAKLLLFAKWWVLSTSVAPEGCEETDKGLDYITHSREIWAVTAMITFYVRLENHFAVHFPGGDPPAGDFLQATGPFVWKYWEEDLIKFADACEQFRFLDRHGNAIAPYFVKPLNDLDARFARAIKAASQAVPNPQ